jgi:AcrR family transcriptional regulator
VTTTHDRIVAAAAELTTESGWAAITMSKLADRVGVSRQTVYNELGSKPQLAEEVVLRELALFLTEVERAFDAHPDDLVSAIRGACRGVLELAQDNRLLKAVVSATHGADTELLPLLTTHSESLLETAKTVVRARVAAYDVSLPDARLDAAIDMVVRVVLSHVMQPSASPETTADDIAWLSSHVLTAGATPNDDPQRGRRGRGRPRWR